jgi:malate dehydrogenase
MERSDLLMANKDIFRVQGEALNQVAKKTVKVCVVGNPANTNALIASHYAPSIPKQNFTALTRLDQNRAYSLLSKNLNKPVSTIRDVIIWGNHSNTQYPDAHFASIDNKPIQQDDFLNGEFLTLVQKRGSAIIDTCGKSSSSSAANAACDHVHDWWHGSNNLVSMAVISDGNTYGVPEGLMFSFPLDVNQQGEWSIRKFDLNDFQKEKLQKSAEELLEERKIALDN